MYQRKYLLWACFLTLLQFLVLKYFFPYPDFISDSYSYIYAADQHLQINIWPIGYSWFLAVVHTVSHSDLVLVTIQYIILQAAGLHFFSTFCFLFHPTRNGRRILFVALLVNPLFLYLGNFINSDALFATLTLLWLAELIWVTHQPDYKHLLLSAGLLVLCFIVRNNAYYYPIVSAIAFLACRKRAWFKAWGIALPVVLIAFFVQYTMTAAQKATGIRQYSLFTGWQLANNALYAYDGMTIDSTKAPNDQSRELNRLARTFYHQAGPDFRGNLLASTGNYFIKAPNAPLKSYFDSHYVYYTEASMITAWGQASSVYYTFGSWLIRTHPAAYVTRFIVPNLRNYFLPPLSNFQIYNMGLHDAWAGGQNWFDWKTPEVSAVSRFAPGYIFFLFPVLFLFLNIYLFGTGIALAANKQFWTLDTPIKQLLVLVAAYLLCNFTFSVATTVNILRYQVVPLIVCIIGGVSITPLLDKKTRTATSKPRPGDTIHSSTPSLTTI